MSVIELVARTFSFQTEDGRFVFRPWGARGPCYLLSKQQRLARAWIQLAFVSLCIAAIAFVPGLTGTFGLLVFFASTAALNYLLFWLFSVGLPTTDKPVTPSPEQRRKYMVAYSRALGRPLLWFVAVISWLFSLVGVAVAFILNQWSTGLAIFLIFGAGGALFTWQLRHLSKSGDA